MRFSWTSGLLAALLAVGAATLAGTPARTADDKKADTAKIPFAGNWRVTFVSGTVEQSFFLFKVEPNDGKATLTIEDALPQIKNDAKITKSDITPKELHFALEAQGLPFGGTVYAPKDGNEKEAKKLLGNGRFNNQAVLLVFDKTEGTALEQPYGKQTDGFPDYQKAATTKDDKEKADALKAILEKFDGKPIAVLASAELMKLKAKSFEKDEDFKVSVDKAVKVAADYGPEKALDTTLQAASALLKADKGAEMALDYARKAEKGLAKDAPANQSLATLKVLFKALRKVKKDDEAKALELRITKGEDELDHEFEKTAIPFKPEDFKGRKAASNRVAVVELFTGAQCPPCVSADIAFDAAAQTFKPKDVVLLEYHLHIPGPDALTNADSEGRQKFYGQEIRGTPTAFVNGKQTPALGGGKPAGKNSYDKLRKSIEDALETDAQGDLLLTAKRKGDKIDVEAKIVDLKKTGDKVHLHFVLVEEVVRYPGNNGQRLHHDIVRAFPGGVEGIEMKEATGKQKVTIDLAEVTKTLTAYLEKANEKRPFYDDERPMALKKLKVIAFIQDDESKEVYQGASVDVPEAK